MIANISDEASAYVRAFKQKIIAPAVEDDDYTENDEDFVHLNTNASDGVPFQLDSLEYENDEEEVTNEIFRDLADEINEDDADIQEIMQFQTNLKYTHEIFRSSTLVDRDIDEDSFPAFDDEEDYDYSCSAYSTAQIQSRAIFLILILGLMNVLVFHALAIKVTSQFDGR